MGVCVGGGDGVCVGGGERGVRTVGGGCVGSKVFYCKHIHISIYLLCRTYCPTAEFRYLGPDKLSSNIVLFL